MHHRGREPLDDIAGALQTLASESVVPNGHDESANVFASPHVERPEPLDPSFRWGRVEFHRINSETGIALVSFRQPEPLAELGKQHCRIVDPRLDHARDPYTIAHANRATLDVLYRVIDGTGPAPDRGRIEITKPS